MLSQARLASCNRYSTPCSRMQRAFVRRSMAYCTFVRAAHSVRLLPHGTHHRNMLMHASPSKYFNRRQMDRLDVSLQQSKWSKLPTSASFSPISSAIRSRWQLLNLGGSELHSGCPC